MPDDKKPNPFDAEALRLKPSVGAHAGVKKLLTQVPVRKPKKHEWFQTHPDPAYRMDMGVIIAEDDNNAVYVVKQYLQDELVDLMVPVTIYTTMTRSGVLLLWPVRLPGDDGRNYDAWVAAHDAAERASKGWTRMAWNASASAYDLFQAPKITIDPEWPDLPFEELLRIGFQGRIIDSPDHLLVRQLRGEA